MRKQSGLTLVELLVTLAILAVLLGVAFPGFQGMMARNSMATSANSIILAANLARGEAVRQSGTTTLVALDSSTATNEWGPGWQVLSVAANAPANPCVAPNCIRQFEGVGTGLTLDSPANVTFIQFNSRGGLVGGVPLQLDLCNPGVDGVRIRITAVGRVSSDGLTAADCP